MSSITEPMSKCQMLAEIRCLALQARASTFAMEAAPVDSFALQQAEDTYDAAAASLVGLLEAAEDSGLMQELADFLTASYGG